MKLLRRMCKKAEKLFQDPVAFPLAAAGAVILFYSVFAYPFYTAMKVSDMKAVYRALSEVNFAELSAGDEEDTEILQGFSDGRLEIMITDEEFHPVYSNRVESPDHQGQIIEQYMVPYQECFQEEPHIYVRKNRNFRSIRLRGLFTQGEGLETEAQEEEQEQRIYYVYMRMIVRSASSAIRYTTNYLCAAAVLMVFLGYLLLRLKGVRPVFVPTEIYAGEMYSAKYGKETQGAALPEENTKDQEDSDEKSASGRKDIPKRRTVRDESSREDLKARQEFVANVSHELKTPLAVISGQMEMLQSMGDRIDQNYYFTSIREEIDKMSKLVGNLLDLTIMEHQMEEMELREMDFSGMVKYMAQKYDALFQRNGIRLSTELAEGCIVYGNRTYLEQAANNYIMNAFQHTPRGKEIRITLVREDGSAKLCVYNEGSSISQEEMGQIWKGFYKESGGSRTNLREFRNAGLGLYFVKKITEIHHGDCGVRNVEKGVEFWLTLPLMGGTE